MTWLNNKKTYQILFLAEIVLLPLVEIYRSFFASRFQIGFLAMEEIVLLLLGGILLLAGIGFAVKEKNTRGLILLGVFLAVFFAYTVLHGIHITHFNASLLPGANPDFLKECYYLVRMYFLPTSLIFSALLLAPSKENLFSALRIAAWEMVLFIVIPTLFGFAFCSYQNGNVTVSGGLFSWFTLPDSASFDLYASKGLFSSANDLAAVLFGLTPFISYLALKKRTWHDFVLLFLLGLSAIAVGTKIGSLGFFLALFATLVLVLLETVLKRDKINLKGLLVALGIFLVLIPLFLVSPGKKLQSVREEQKETAARPTENIGELSSVLEGDLGEDDTKALADYLEKHHWDHFIDPWFLELYPVTCDPEFWSAVTSRPNHLNSDSRTLKLEMIERIQTRNGNSGDRLLGIGYTSGVPYAERDYFHQYYLFGITGLIVLLAPFVFLFARSGILFVKNLFGKKPFVFWGVCALSLFTFFATAYYAGHVLDTVYTTYFLALAGVMAVGTEQQDEA